LDSNLLQLSLLRTTLKLVFFVSFVVWFPWVGLRLHAVGAHWRLAFVVMPVVIGGAAVAYFFRTTAPTLAVSAALISAGMVVFLCLKKSVPKAKRRHPDKA
jgi:uncharacterized membrane protein YhaH (DUF805 family)